jgi:hypothetical protein
MRVFYGGEGGILGSNRREMIRQHANGLLQPGRPDLVTIRKNRQSPFLALFVVRRGLEQCFVSYKICLLMISADKFSTLNQQE